MAPRTFTVRSSSIAACRIKSLAPSHYRDDGTCLCRLAVDDIERALTDERHLGFGYAERKYLSATRRAEIDEAVIARANELGWTYEQFFEWANSKNGRWLCDAASDIHMPAAELAERLVKPWRH